MSGRITITGLEVFAYHGVLIEEKLDGQMFYLDIELELPLDAASRSDDLGDTVNYDEVCRVAHDTMAAECYDLIERAAGAVCDAILDGFGAVDSVTVTVHKPSAPVCRKVSDVAVRLTRSRG